MRRKFNQLVLVGVVSILNPTVVCGAGFEENCANFKENLVVENGTIMSTDFVPAGTNLTLPNIDPSCPVTTQMVLADLCRVTLDLATSDRSSTYVEAWLPRDWPGRRFLATGNSGIGGCVHYWDMAYASALGFATTGSNNGHWGGMNLTSLLDNDDAVVDFSWRAVHASSTAGMSIAEQFYGQSHDRSYFLGCSTGGRQGFKMAQDFAGLFDGILAGAPTLAFGYLLSFLGSFYPLIKAAGYGGVPPSSTFEAIDAAFLDQCDDLDGAEDGIIEDPSKCHFNTSPVICTSDTSNSSTCLTKKQAGLVEKLLSPLFSTVEGNIFPRMNPFPGLVAGMLANFGGDSQFLYTDHWFKYAVYDDPDSNTSNLTPEQWQYAWEKDPGGSNTWSGDLSAARDAGTRIMHIHGTADPLVTSILSSTYYDRVSDTMELDPAELDEFYRFFRVGGMGHCFGGGAENPPADIGMYLLGPGLDRLPSMEPDENVLLALVRWVEEGIAPETITGVAYNGGDPTTGVDYKKRHCKYPARNTLVGTDDFKDINAWECVE